jgi:2-polyprenyl-3-methyl-5-hydroxy-6-metoxy-1,4-benzoquinol methylase
VTTPSFDYQGAIPPGFYDEIWRRGEGVRFSWHDLKFRAVARELGRPSRLLDIGCGPGTFIGNYAPGLVALGIDVSEAQIAYANEHYGTYSHRFAVRTTADLVAAGERFDGIALIEVIEHLPRPDAARLLADARKLLTDDGHLVLTTPNYASLWPLIELGVNLASRVSYEAQHINKYRRRRLLADLKAAGFGNVAIRTAVGLAPFTAAFGPRAANAVDEVEEAIGHLGCGNLLLAVASPAAS